MTTWTFAGTALTDFGKITILDDYLDLPAKRGNNQTIPFRDGTIFTQKYFEERTVLMGIAINTTSATTLESTFDSMRKLFGRRTEATLTATMEDSTTRSALASVNKPLQVGRKSANVALAVIEFDMCTPYFRSGTVIADNTTTINAGTVAMNVINTGTAQERDPIITMVGPLNNPVITNSTNGYSLTYAGTIAGTLVIQTTSGEYVAANGTANVIGNLTHSGGACMMAFEPGTNVMSIVNSVGTTGTVKASFYAPYF